MNASLNNNPDWRSGIASDYSRVWASLAKRSFSQRYTRKWDKVILCKPQKTINSRQHSQVSQDVCRSHHLRSCAFSELFKLISLIARTRVSAKIKTVKNVVQWTSLRILLILTASFLPGLLPVDVTYWLKKRFVQNGIFSIAYGAEFLSLDKWSF